MSAPCPVIVTRPAAQAASWCAALQAALGDAVALHALPLIAISPVEEPAYRQRLLTAWSHLANYHAALFVSVPAVQHFFAVQPHCAALFNAQGLRAWAPGRGTRQALLDAGVDPQRIDSPPPDAAQFDSETLWQHIASQMPACRAQQRKVLRVRGTDLPANAATAADHGAGRDWFSAALAQQGIGVDSVVAYRRACPLWTENALQASSTLHFTPSVWVFSSSLAIQHLAALLPARSWQAHTAIATHPRIDEAAHALGFGRVADTRPTVACVAESIALSMN